MLLVWEAIKGALRWGYAAMLLQLVEVVQISRRSYCEATERYYNSHQECIR